MLQHARISAHADEQLELGVGRPQPEPDDERGQQQRGHGVDPPAHFGAEHGAGQTGPVDEQVVAVVLPQDADLAVRVAQRVAVEEEAEFGCEGDANDDC